MFSVGQKAGAWPSSFRQTRSEASKGQRAQLDVWSGMIRGSFRVEASCSGLLFPCLAVKSFGLQPKKQKVMIVFTVNP